ncbi:DUF1460 domain-containing protein [Candidatus Fermentibacteria bacterium]|nr:DUF1460 domain-containing protein [Candidatus Fermentibacteria bacterium]
MRTLAALQGITEPRDRLAAASGLLLGARYRRNPLGGGPGLPERGVVTLSFFDCVTYVESVAALALSKSPDDYRRHLMKLRYGARAPSWLNRLHYWSQWSDVHARRGIIRPVTPTRDTVRIRRSLSTIKSVPPAAVELVLHPWSSAIPEADIVGFGSQRADLDVFHVGILRRDRLRHASRRAGQVIEEPLADFLTREQGSGLLLARLQGGEE